MQFFSIIMHKISKFRNIHDWPKTKH
jgi:hypothetical protein